MGEFLRFVFALAVLMLGLAALDMALDALLEEQRIRSAAFRACVATLQGPVNDPGVCGEVWEDD